MPYIQLTTRCNHQCPHCCFDCISQGEDMSWETFQAVKDYFESETISLGGGEPTLHPLFEKILLHSITAFEHVWLATNGSQTEISLALSELAKMGVIGCALSQDEYHDPIDNRVVKAFTKDKRIRSYNSSKCDYREIRTVQKAVEAGRCDWGKSECPCDTLFVKPSGDVHWCGCENALKLGNIHQPDKLSETIRLHEYWELDCCWNNKE